MTSRQLLALAMVLLVAAVGSAVAPSHPAYNPPWAKFVLGAWALLAAAFAREAARWPPEASRDLDEIEFAISFDDRVVSLSNPDGSTDSGRWDDLESVSIDPDDDPQFWIGPYFVRLNFRGGPICIPAWSRGRDELLERLLDLPGIDRDRLEALLSGGLSALKERLLEPPGSDWNRVEASSGKSRPLGRYVLWVREKGT